MEENIAKELRDIRETIQDCMRRLNAFSDLRDDAQEGSIEDAQVGLTETFEIAVASADSVTNAEVALAELYEMIIGGDEE